MISRGKKKHIPGVTGQVFQMPFALWDVSHPLQNVAWAVEKFLSQTGKLFLLFMTQLSFYRVQAWLAEQDFKGVYVFCFLKGKRFHHSGSIFQSYIQHHL